MSFGFVGKMEMRRVDSGMFGALLTVLFKAFDCLDNELLITKPNASAYQLIHDYLSNIVAKT